MTTVNYEALAAALQIGDKSGGNFMEIGTDGSFRLMEDATEFDDLEGPLFGKKLYSAAGTLDTDWDNSCLKFQASGTITDKNDRVQWNSQILHKFKNGAAIKIYPHIHWIQQATTKFAVTWRYRLAKNGVALPSWTDVTFTLADGDEKYTYPGSGDFVQITTGPDITLDVDVSDIFQSMFTRTDGLSGNLLILYADCHMIVDSVGSRTEWTK